LFLLTICQQVHQNTQRLERLERALASREEQFVHPPTSDAQLGKP